MRKKGCSWGSKNLVSNWDKWLWERLYTVTTHKSSLFTLQCDVLPVSPAVLYEANGNDGLLRVIFRLEHRSSPLLRSEIQDQWSRVFVIWTLGSAWRLTLVESSLRTLRLSTYDMVLLYRNYSSWQIFPMAYCFTLAPVTVIVKTQQIKDLGPYQNSWLHTT